MPVFYFLHQVNENFAAGLFPALLLLVFLHTAAGILLTLLFRFWLKDTGRAAMVSAWLVGFNLFFGYLHDQSKSAFGPQAFFNRYSYIILFLVLFTALLLFLLKRKKPGTGKLFYFLNILFPVLALFETTLLWQNIRQQPKMQALPAWEACDSCDRPDIYVIIADEYAGARELKDIFSFDNSAFETALGQRGFHIVKESRSNYNATVYSMASLFSMDYLPLRGKGLVTQDDMLFCRNLLNKNTLLDLLQQNGYRIHNNSFFDLQGRKKALRNFYFHPRTRILSFGTFINRFRIHSEFNFFSKAKAERVAMNDFNNDEKADSLLRWQAMQTGEGPRFIYTHFTRPHHPYYLDSQGKPFQNTGGLTGFDLIRKMYTEHLLYTNGRLLQLIDHILLNAKKKPVILLASDHGFRQFDKPVDPAYYFMNFTAVLLPGGDYSRFRDGLSPVNSFRAILNSTFGQRLPMLKDSSIFLTEKAMW